MAKVSTKKPAKPRAPAKSKVADQGPADDGNHSGGNGAPVETASATMELEPPTTPIEAHEEDVKAAEPGAKRDVIATSLKPSPNSRPCP